MSRARTRPYVFAGAAAAAAFGFNGAALAAAWNIVLRAVFRSSLPSRSSVQSAAADRSPSLAAFFSAPLSAYDAPLAPYWWAMSVSACFASAGVAGVQPSGRARRIAQAGSDVGVGGVAVAERALSARRPRKAHGGHGVGDSGGTRFGHR